MRLFKHKSIIITFICFIIFIYILNYFFSWHESFAVQKPTANMHKALAEKQAQSSSGGGLPGMNEQPTKVGVIGGKNAPVPDASPGGTQIVIGNETIQFDKYGNVLGTSTSTSGSSGGSGGSGGSTTPSKKPIPVTCPNGQPSGGFICCANGQPSGGFSCCPDGTPSGGKPCKTIS